MVDTTMVVSWSNNTITGPYTLSHLENDRDVSAWYRVNRENNKGIPGLAYKLCVLQRLSFDALSDVTVVLEMRLSIGRIVGLGIGFNSTMIVLIILVT